jgi:hypothetical protein
VLSQMSPGGSYTTDSKKLTSIWCEILGTSSDLRDHVYGPSRTATEPAIYVSFIRVGRATCDSVDYRYVLRFREQQRHSFEHCKVIFCHKTCSRRALITYFLLGIWNQWHLKIEHDIRRYTENGWNHT